MLSPLSEKKNPVISTSVGEYIRYAEKTHFVDIGESYIDLVEKYVKPDYQEGDILSISEKIIALCQKRVVYKKDMKLSRLAKFLSKFASTSTAGVGVNCVWKMQFAIDLNGPVKILWASFCSAVGKIFGKRGVFYKIAGEEVKGLDGFYDHVFDEYGEYGIRVPEDPSGVCDDIYNKTGVRAMIVDANDIEVEILGKGSAVEFDDKTLIEMIADNPAGQSAECTPFIIVRKNA